MAWTKLDTRTITLSPPEAPPVAWTKLDTQIITLSPEVAPPPVEEWVLLDRRFITLTPLEEIPSEVGWIKLDTKTITLTPGEVPPIPPEYKLVYHHEYPRGKTYVGKAEQCTTDVTVPLPEQLFPNNWVVEKIADTFAQNVEQHDAEMLDIKIYQDITPLWVTNYKIVAVATASPVPWAIIIPLVLAIILVVAFTFLIREVKTIDWGKAAFPILAVGLGIAALAGLGIALTRKKK